MTTIAGLLMRHVRLPRKKRPRQLTTKPMNLHQNQNHSQSLLKRRPKSASENRLSIKSKRARNSLVARPVELGNQMMTMICWQMK